MKNYWFIADNVKSCTNERKERRKQERNNERKKENKRALQKEGKRMIAIIKMRMLRKAWHSPKIIYLEMGPNHAIEGGESENRGPEARVRVIYAVANVVLENSKIVKERLNLSNLVSNALSR